MRTSVIVFSKATSSLFQGYRIMTGLFVSFISWLFRV
jgi:hypothetical protein